MSRKAQGEQVASRGENAYVGPHTRVTNERTRAMFITFEGLDSSGKTTQANLLVQRLQDLPPPSRRRVHFIREPGGTHISELIRELLLDTRHEEMSDAAELLLFSASRAQLVREVIRPALKRGDVVVCDRFADSTTAYQGYGRGINLQVVQAVHRLAVSGTNPDLTLFVDIPVEEVARRKARAGMTEDRMEVSGREFFERVRAGYLKITAGEPGRVVCLDGTRPIEVIARDVWSAVERTMHTLTGRDEQTKTTGGKRG